MPASSPRSALAAILLLGCQASEPGPTAVAQLSADIPTVVTVRWSDPDAQGGRVEFGPDTTYGMEAPARVNEAGELRADLLGLKPNALVHFRVVTETDGGDREGDDQSILTGSSPSDLPTVQTELLLPDETAGGYVLSGMFGGGRSGAVVMDTDGDVVWWSLAEDRLSVRPVLSVDGASVVYNILSEDLDTEHNALVRAALDGSGVQNIPAPGHHHDFAELPDGTLAYLAYDVREVDGEWVYGDRLVEVDPDGTQTEIFNVWDHLDYEAGPPLGPGETWTHANAVDYDPSDDSYYVGFRSLSAIWKVDRATGEPIWQLGGPRSDFAFEDAAAAFTMQHQFEWLGDAMLVFDNGPEFYADSRALELALDEEAMVASLRWEYKADPAVYCYVLGDVDRLAGGNTLVTFTTAGQIDEVSPDGALVWRLNVGIGAGMAYTRQVDSFYAED